MKKKIICAFLAIVMIVGSVGVLASCNGDDTPTECEHVDKKGDGVCDKCGEKLEASECKHVDKKTGKKTGPDGICDKCGEEAPTAHKTCPDKDKDGFCDIELCGKPVEGEDKGTIDGVYWDSVDLIYQLTAHDTTELSSTCARTVCSISSFASAEIISSPLIAGLT